MKTDNTKPSSAIVTICSVLGGVLKAWLVSIISKIEQTEPVLLIQNVAFAKNGLPIKIVLSSHLCIMQAKCPVSVLSSSSIIIHRFITYTNLLVQKIQCQHPVLVLVNQVSLYQSLKPNKWLIQSESYLTININIYNHFLWFNEFRFF